MERERARPHSPGNCQSYSIALKKTLQTEDIA